MANKRKKRKSRGGSSRRRMGKIPGGDGVQTLIGAVLGSVGSRFAAKLITEKAKLDPKILNVLFLAAGGMLAIKSRNPLLKGAGIGLGSAGAIGLGQTLGLLNGVGMGAYTPYLTRRPMLVNGFRDVSKVGANGSQQFFPSPSAVGKVGSMDQIYAGVYG